MKEGNRHEATGNSKAEVLRALISFKLLAIVLLASVSSATAQQANKAPLVGTFVVPPPLAVAPRLNAFRQRLRELGYIEGKTIVIESRSAEGKLERLPALAAKLVRLKVDVVVSNWPDSPAECAGADGQSH
jgi:ABC-type uncharacterized transport system substrate-binding protein